MSEFLEVRFDGDLVGHLGSHLARQHQRDHNIVVVTKAGTIFTYPVVRLLRSTRVDRSELERGRVDDTTLLAKISKDAPSYARTQREEMPSGFAVLFSISWWTVKLDTLEEFERLFDFDEFLPVDTALDPDVAKIDANWLARELKATKAERDRLRRAEISDTIVSEAKRLSDEILSNPKDPYYLFDAKWEY